MRKLINLRHLELYGSEVSELPKGIGRLTSLRTLTRFPIIGDHFRRDVCKIGELKNLNSLRGGLVISGIVNVKDAEEAGEAELKNKKHLHHLELSRLVACLSCFKRLESLPERLLQITSLQELNISGSPTLEDRYHEETGEDWSKISHIQRVLAGDEEFYYDSRSFKEKAEIKFGNDSKYVPEDEGMVERCEGACQVVREGLEILS
ncbi:putative disease resistance RPP13-like protein 1 [Vitis vinifera]|uniref:Putative disease resistance RPP13-like protein 1 n=1 Tax=Vitis vinifera TaxID=29760 RepID=A0A438HFG0_VITVI|nr:putative disease resistance RPP13-like protein 1 [Vitis vinifera]